ncbi:hypothetical protein MUP35_04645 [Patescibacteria group bacterium]|nr:hypothetical protein [Patescibacteria group bacterium]
MSKRITKRQIPWNKGKLIGELGRERFSVGQKHLFDWIKDKNLSHLLARDFTTANLCLKHGFDKPAIILYAGVLEAILGYILKREDLDFSKLIDQSLAQGFISEPNRDKLQVLRDFRNYVHLLLELKGEFQLEGISQFAKRICELVIDSLKEKL